MTGAARGIGQAIVRFMLDEVRQVAMPDRDNKELAMTSQGLENTGACDVLIGPIE
ncbi:hypothetical protein [Roseibium marinum]|uniref:hypothetical protein n=1 Tax=Roseibium marinum TaxID=281252 RepID=UPI0011AF4F5D|nr:hypothetical protein [Roseibium marinum]